MQSGGRDGLQEELDGATLGEQTLSEEIEGGSQGYWNHLTWFCRQMRLPFQKRGDNDKVVRGWEEFAVLNG